jgi:hypothetical protein
MKDDEKALLLAIARSPKSFPRDIINGLLIHHKRAWYLLEKWARRGWYEYGVSLDLGWLTDAGKQAALAAREGKNA